MEPLQPDEIGASEEHPGEKLAEDGRLAYPNSEMSCQFRCDEDDGKSKNDAGNRICMTAGFSLKDYYTVNGGQTFGYFQGGPQVTAQLKFIPPAYGNWALKAGVQLLWLNSNLETVNTGDSFAPIGSIGLAMTY